MDVIHSGIRPPASKYVLLIVDDEMLGRAPLVDEFEEFGYTVLEAVSAAEALLCLRGGARVDVLITDIRMPGHIDGIGLARIVRTQFPRTRVVLMSSSIPDRATRESVDGYFQKPFRLADIREHVRRLIPQ